MASRQGFEPRPSVLETAMLPLTPARYMVLTEGNDPSSIAYQASALPLSYASDGRS